jgi:hypothetical protein
VRNEETLRTKINETVLDMFNYSKTQSFHGKVFKQSFTGTIKPTPAAEEDIDRAKMEGIIS